MRPVADDPALNWDLGPPPSAQRRMLIVVVSIVGTILLAAGAWQLLRSEPETVNASAPKAVGDTVLLAPPSGYEGAAGYPVGFPHTELGAASAAAAALEAAWTLDAEQAQQAAVLYAPPEQHEAARAGAREAVAGWREILGLPKDGALPDGAAMRTRTIGIQWRPRGQDQMHVSVLVQVTATKGVGDTDPTYSSPYAMSLLMVWQPGMRGANQGDWVNVPDPLATAVPPVALPGTPEFTAAGWKPISGPEPTQ
ncbi:hypothetical protein OG884_15920 [Streptosporangium sp. NBC_01755]|uniref:hypothetical protein n=1 Tax=unclassified Streptosporangium TaxID=2632669 RepID=UPI002DD80401|nr:MULTISPECIES: hypothetical protein [unclassified Streptosporangium]WSA25365.1 hypothetical protein OIE13_31315 [Streptosporangium sp. NBC_01810]WSD03319.1 hypothetical protein OG884_15920 [Streptosporangium sp. NBC_01755]